MFEPIVSIIIPIFNAEETISRCIKSLFSQSVLDSLEFIFIDDCSSDNSVEVLSNHLQESNLETTQYKIIRFNENKGSAYSRAVGIREANGKYLGFCDSDDWVERDMYERMVERIQSTNADIVECGYFINNCNGESVFKIKLSDNIIRDIVSNKHPACLWNKLFSRKLFDVNDVIPFGGMGEDFVFCIQAFIRSRNYSFLDVSLYHYWLNPDSISNSSQSKSVCMRAIDLRNNSLIVFDLLEKNGRLQGLNNAIIVRKILSKIMLSPMMSQIDVRRMFYYEIFPEIDVKIFFRNIPFAYKKAYLLAITTLKSRIFGYGH